MGISRFLNCFVCEGNKKAGNGDLEITPAIRIDAKSPLTTTNCHASSSSSEVDFSSKLEKEKSPLTPPPSPKKEKTKTNKALIVASKGTYALVENEFPILKHGKEVIIRNMATGLNPIDFKSVDFNFCLPAFPWVTGREMAGVVEVVGEEVRGLKVGERVWTSTYYRDHRAGCFQEFVTVPSHTVLPLPSNLSFDSGACLGVAALTAAMTLWNWLDVPMSPPSPTPEIEVEKEKEYLLIWGGSTVTGQFAIQIAVHSGLSVLAVTSTKTKELAEDLGAVVIIRDGKSNEEIVEEIRKVAGDNVTKAIDLVGTKTAGYCLQAMSRDERRECIFAPLAMMSSKEVVKGNVRVETVEMKRFVLDEGCRRFAERLNGLVEQGVVRMPGMEVLEGGLGVVEEGLERLKGGDMGGRKMVVRMG